MRPNTLSRFCSADTRRISLRNCRPFGPSRPSRRGSPSERRSKSFGVGPTFNDGRLLRDFPNPPDQVTFVSQGKGVMPSFAGVLNASQLAEVVAYERQVLSKRH